jgi:hypothetical protein
MLMVGRGWGLCIGWTRGGISVVDTRERFKTRVRVVNTEVPVRVKKKHGRRIYTQAGIKVPRIKNTGL